jgi:hypothetical protein
MPFAIVPVSRPCPCCPSLPPPQRPVESARPTQRPAATESAAQQVRFEFFGSPAPTGAHCPTPSRPEGAYTVLIGPTTGRPGAKVILSENTPLFDEAGRYIGPSGKIGFWFNMPFDRWETVYTSDRPPASANGAPVVHLGEASVADQCSYRVSFRVPDVPPGTYGVVAIEHGAGGSAPSVSRSSSV